LSALDFMKCREVAWELPAVCEKTKVSAVIMRDENMQLVF